VSSLHVDEMQGSHGGKHSAGSARIVRITLPHNHGVVASAYAMPASEMSVPGSADAGSARSLEAGKVVGASSPATLQELAALAGVEEGDFADFTDSDFDDLAKELDVSTVTRVKLRKQFKLQKGVRQP
jgi:hypothetical protein